MLVFSWRFYNWYLRRPTHWYEFWCQPQMAIQGTAFWHFCTGFMFQPSMWLHINWLYNYYDALKLSAVVVSIAFILHTSSGIFSAHMHTSRLTVINLTLKFNKQLIQEDYNNLDFGPSMLHIQAYRETTFLKNFLSLEEVLFFSQLMKNYLLQMSRIWKSSL